MTGNVDFGPVGFDVVVDGIIGEYIRNQAYDMDTHSAWADLDIGGMELVHDLLCPGKQNTVSHAMVNADGRDAGVEEYVLVDFDLDMADFNHIPIRNELLIQNLEDSRTECISREIPLTLMDLPQRRLFCNNYV